MLKQKRKDMKAKFKKGESVVYGNDNATVTMVDYCNCTNQFVYNLTWLDVNAFGEFIKCGSRNVEERILKLKK